MISPPNVQSNPGGKDGPPVGLAPDINLSRRVQLAVLAHIRHTHTRYDHLLKETTYVNARKAVESLCLDVLVKWRGDEETGRDQLDEILCEVIVISESESDDSDDDDEDDSSDSSSADEKPAGRLVQDDGAARMIAPPVDLPPAAPLATNTSRGGRPPRGPHVSRKKIKKPSRTDRRAAKWAQRGFNRYQAAWHEAVERQRHENDGLMQHSGPPPLGRSASHGPQPWRAAELGRLDPALPVARNPAEPSYHVFHAHGAALPLVDVSRERGAHEQAVTYNMPQQQARAQENPAVSGFRPIIGSRAVPEVERVSYRGQDLKDYLVQSIEPASPRPSNFPPRSSIASHQPERGLPERGFPHGGENSVRDIRPRAPVRAADEFTSAQGLHPAYAEEGFIRLPPRPQPNRMPIAPDPRSEPFILLNPLPVSSAAGGRVVAATADGLGLGHSSTWQDDAAARGRDLGLRTGLRRPWIGHDGVVLRSESRPIVIQDYPSPPRQSRVDAAYAPLESRRLSPTRWVDARHIGPGEVGERDRRHADSGIEQRIETLQDDFVEIVRVSSKFPRQHEPRPVSAGTGRYNLRSAPAQQNASRQPTGSVPRHDIRRLAQGQRLERVVGRVEVPVFPDENGYQRQERVVGIEYIHPRPRYSTLPTPISTDIYRADSLETRTYSDRGPFHEANGPVYRSRSNSVAPLPYPGLPYHQPHSGRPTPKRDEVIMLD